MNKEATLKAIGLLSLVVSLLIIGLYFYNDRQKPGSLIIAFSSLASGMRLLRNGSEDIL